ncbi:MAG: hypothetical protein HZB29_07320 [Nitrospinae bacterium]|nr:hypothetical protein [Nitrospinota bacterium]
MTRVFHDSHMPRKLFHALTASIIPTVYLFEPVPRSLVTALMVAAAFGWLAFDTARIRNEKVNLWFARHFAFLMKKKEAHVLTGVAYMLGGTALALILFSPVIAVTVLYFISLGDPAAAILGKKFGRFRLHNGRSLEGSLAMFAVCVAVAVGIGGFPLPLSVAGAAAAAAAELYSGPVDDNLTVPLISGAVLAALG